MTDYHFFLQYNSQLAGNHRVMDIYAQLP
jgi:hypothetical protein